MPDPVRVLILEDNAADAELMAIELRRAGLNTIWSRVDTEAAFLAALEGRPEVILADYALPGWNALAALDHLRKRQLDIPCLVITGNVGDEVAAECIKQGAYDFLLKDRLSRLGRAVLHALEQQRLRTAKRQADEALRERSAQLQALTAELTLAEHRERRRVAEVLHGDLQQLLVGAKLLIGSLNQTADPGVRDTCREATDLIAQAIQVSRSLTEELSPPILHRGDLVSALEWLAGWIREKHNLAVVVRVIGPAVVHTEDTAVLLFQAIRELLLNTVKHAHVDTAEVEISRRDDQVRVTVSDAGMGFDPTQFRVAGGTAGGFGLFSIRERLELLGGRLEIESAPGNGSRFILCLPLRPVMLPVDTANAVAPAGTEKSTGRTGGGDPTEGGERKTRVIVVEEHLIVRQGLIRLLAKAPDITVVGEAADGETAVALTRELSPDVVTMDVDLPGMSGIEATRLIHSCCPAARVIGLSVHEEAAQAAAMREAGAVRYLTKSAPAETLLAAIRACVLS